MSTVLEKVKKVVGKLPDSSGVYFFVGKNKKILYIGKATSLKTRVRSYFAGDILEKRSPLIAKMVEEARDVKFQETESVLEALILEANLIRKHIPPYNTALKDQKSWNFVVITKEDFPRVMLVRERELNLQTNDYRLKSSYGPFTNSYELRDAMKIIRKIFPYRDRCIPFNPSPSQGEGQGVRSRACFNYQIGLCPGVCVGKVSKQEYAKTIKHIKMFFEGKKTQILSSLRKEMKLQAKSREFEEAEKIKWKIASLQHIHDIALIRKEKPPENEALIVPFRIEAYDIAHMSGTNVVGVMTVVEDGEPKKSDYRKFKIKIDRNNDVAALREVIGRRLNHAEWNYPDLIVVDGSDAQINVTKAELEKRQLIIPVVSVLKDEHHKAKEIKGRFFPQRKKEILLANSEAHRFAITYHRNLRSRF